MNVVFVEPFFPSTQRNFVRGLAEVGATVIGIGEYPTDSLDEQLKSWMTHYHHVPSVVDVGVMTDAVRWIQGKVWVDRLEATIESHTSLPPRCENCTIPGTSVRTAWLCRDKPSMKEVLRSAACRPPPRELPIPLTRCTSLPTPWVSADPQATHRCRCPRHDPRGQQARTRRCARHVWRPSGRFDRG